MKKITEKAAKLQSLISELSVISSDLTEAYAEFNRVTDSAMIESAVYTVNSLHSRYDFTLRQIKALPGDDASDLMPYASVYNKKRRLSIE